MLHTDSFGFDAATPRHARALDACEYVLAAFFTLELLLRTASRRSARELATSFLWWIDLLSVAPFYVDVIVTAVTHQHHAAVVGLFRVLRVLRLLKV